MSIAINKEKCVGCGRCTKVCPGSLIKRDESGKAYIKYPRDCWGCVSCVKECNVEAIDFYLGADIGGRGSRMKVKSRGDMIYWNITRPDGEKVTIEIDRTKSNQY